METEYEMITDCDGLFSDNDSMSKSIIRSGPAVILSSGKVRSYKDYPIELEVYGINLIFEQVRDKSERQGIFLDVSNESSGPCRFSIFNKNTWIESTGEHSIAKAEYETDNGRLEREIEVYFRYTPLHDNSFTIDYTLYRVDPSQMP